MRWRAFPAILLGLGLGFLATAAPAYFDPFSEAGIARLTAARLPDGAVLTDQDGRRVRLGEYLNGPPVVFAAVAYNCPNLCGLTLDGLFSGLAGAGLEAGRDYQLVVTGIDPREGPADAARLLAQLGRRRHLKAAGIHFLTGPEASLRQVEDAMGIRAGWDGEHQQYAHISAAAVTRPDGRLSRWLMGVEFDPRELRLALVEAGRGKVGTLGDQVLLLCYGYDPVHGRYGLAVRRLLMGGGAATVGALLLFMVLSGRRGRA